MDWTPFIKGGIPTLGATLFFAIALTLYPRTRKRKKDCDISFAKLKQERDVLAYLLYYSVMWMLWVAPNVEDVPGKEWMAIIFGISLWIVRYLLLYIVKFLNLPPKKESLVSHRNN